jgi:predicted nucleotidyltransferase
MEEIEIMNAVGVIVEYNPFHNGHAYHVQAAKEYSGADIVIAVMSGNFLQRGEPALVSKWTRTKMALYGGVDIVIELPYFFATQKAEVFANGAVSILTKAGCQSFCFGSESGDIDSFYQTAAFLEEHQEAFDREVKREIGLGNSYPKALSLAFKNLSPKDTLIDLTQPNNILGFQYIQAVLQQKSKIQAITVSRKNANYHDEHFASSTIASATSIRKAFFTQSDGSESIQQYVPSFTSELLMDYYKRYRLLHQWENYWPYLKYRLLHISPNELQEIYEIEEGLENRFISAVIHAESFEHFMTLVKTKRYTWTRLQRACVHVLTNTKKKEMKIPNKTASYLRLLGMTTNGKQYLNKMKDHIDLPIVSKLSAFQNEEIELDIKASRIYSLGVPADRQSEFLKQEFSQPPIFI